MPRVFTSFLQDLAYSIRGLRKSPLFTATAVLLIALGAGAVTTIYSAANALLLRPIPGIGDPGSLVEIERTQADGSGSLSASYPYAQMLRERTPSLSGVVAWSNAQLSLGVGTAHLAGRANLVTANYFDVLHVAPELGRFFVSAEDSGAGAHPVVVISHGFWQRALGGDPSVIGRVIDANGTPLTVIGVAPREFDGTMPVLQTDAWIPLTMQPQVRPGADLLTSADAGWLELFGRLRPGVSRDAAQAEIANVTQQMVASGVEAHAFREFSSARLHRLTMVPPKAYTAALAFFAVLFSIALLVLLIASVNIAGMVLARGIGRQRELAVRAALGAGRRRLIAQLLTETLVLYGAGAIAGIALAFGGTQLLARVQIPAPIPIVLHLGPDFRVLALALGIALAAGLVFGLAPAIRASRSDPATALHGGSDRTGSNRSRARSVLVAAQMALSLVLLVAAGLFMRALQRGQQVDPGIDVRGVATAELNLEVAGFDSAKGTAAFDRLKRELLGTPGVTAVSYSHILPLSLSTMAYDMRISGYTPPRTSGDSGAVSVGVNIVDGDYFTVMHTPLVAGRTFAVTDNARAARVLVVNQAFAHRSWPGLDPLGRTVTMSKVPYTVVGVVRDAKYGSLAEPPTPHAFLATAQTWDGDRQLLVRTSGNPAALASTIRDLTRTVMPDLPTPRPSTLATETSIVLLPQRVAATITGSLGAIGLLLAAVGLYGVMAYSLSQRTRELGIRMALGADRRNVLGLVLGEGLRLVGVGIAIGLVLAFGVTRFMQPFLFGVSPLDPVTLGAVTAGLAAVALLAAYVPARRAAAADPAAVLRSD